MKNPKGSGSVVKRKTKDGRVMYYPRWVVSGRYVYGHAHDDIDSANKERIEQNPNNVRGSLRRKREIPSLKTWAARCLDGAYGKSIADSTFATNETILNSHIEQSLIGSMRIDKIARVDCIEFIESRKGSGRTVRRIVAFISHLMNLAIDMEYRRDNPFKGLGRHMPPSNERQNRVLNLSEARRLLARTPERRIDAMIMFALLTGLRRGEICRLQWGHILDGGTQLDVPGTKNKTSRRRIPLNATARDILQSQPKRGIWIFTTEDGNMIDAHNVTRDFRLRKAELKLPGGMRFHDLRGTYASLALEQGADVRSLMQLTGHSKSQTLLEVYARSSQEQRIAIVNQLDRALCPKKKRAVNGGSKHA